MSAFLNADMSETMLKQISYLRENIDNDSLVSNITLLFYTPDQPDVKVFLSREIKEITIKQDFVSNYTDKITGKLELQLDPFQSLFYMGKNLLCDLAITYVSPESTSDYAEPNAEAGIKRTFRCTFPNIEDIFKKFPKEQLRPDKRARTDNDTKIFNLEFELIEDQVYKARKQQLHLITRYATIDQMIKYAISYFGFTMAYVRKPDNEKQYTNFIIPPAKGIENIMGFFQNSEGLGVYNDGFNSYIVGGCWYIYPRFGAPLNKHPIHVYSIGNGKYAGMNRYDYVEEPPQTQKVASAASAIDVQETAIAAGKVYTGTATVSDYKTLAENAKKAYDAYNAQSMNATVHIICNTELNEKNWSNVGSENEITASCVQNTDAILDGTRTLLLDDVYNITTRVSYHGVVPKEPISKDNYSKVDFRKSDSNMFAIRSALRAFQGTTYTFTWRHARPWVFTPATIVEIHYDDATGEYKTAKGICEGAVYKFIRSDGNGQLAPKFTCDGDITINDSFMESVQN